MARIERDHRVEPAAALAAGLGAQDRHEREGEDHRRDGEEHVEQHAHDDVDLAAEVAADEPERAAEHEAQEHREASRPARVVRPPQMRRDSMSRPLKSPPSR